MTGNRYSLHGQTDGWRRTFKDNHKILTDNIAGVCCFNLGKITCKCHGGNQDNVPYLGLVRAPGANQSCTPGCKVI